MRRAEQLVDPDRYPYSVLLPDRNPKHRCTRKFTKSFTISSATAGCSDGFRVAVLPSLDAPIVYSGPNASLPSVAGSYRVTGSMWIDDATVSHSTLRADAGDSHALLTLKKITDGAGRTCYAFSASNTVSANVNDAKMVVTLKDSRHAHIVKLDLVALVAGVWVSKMNNVLVRNNNASVGYASTAATAVGFDLAGIQGAHAISFDYTVGGASTGQVQAVEAVDMTQGTLLTSLRNVAEYGRLTGLSLLITNTSSSLGKNGNIYTARVPHRQSPFSNPFDIQKDVTDFHRGDAAHGSYVWWLPGEESTRTMSDLIEATDQLESDSFLWAQVEGWGGTNVSTVLVTVTACVEFYALSQLYEKVPPPIQDPQWERTMGILARLPSATCNPDHKAILQSILQNGKDMYDKASNHYTANRGLYDALLKMMLGSV